MTATTVTGLPLSTVGGYRVAERLGEGGMGEVFRAVDTMLEREVALKVLRPEMGARAELVERFRVEAIALARLHHRHIAAVYSFFQDAGQHFIAMQYVRGRTLEATLQQGGPLPWREAAAVAMDVLQALEHAHALGVVHRDLKPANLMLDSESRTVVMDFGIARVLARNRQTRAGTLVGTLEYIAPEIVRGEVADARSDLYSLGCVLYEMVTGVLPFEAQSDFALMRAHAEQAPPRPGVRASDLPAALETIILRALEKQPSRRFANARDFFDALAAACRDQPPVSSARTTAWIEAVHQRAEQAGEHAAAAVRWLGLPVQGGWPAWRDWVRLNMGLASAAGVAAFAVCLGLGMASYEACCSVRPVVADGASDRPSPTTHSARTVDTAGAVTTAAAPALEAAPPPVMTPVRVAEPVAQVAADDPPPLWRAVRPVSADAPVTQKASIGKPRPASAAAVGPTGPAPQAWYVKR